MQLAEDIVSDTFLQAMKSWSHHGIPDSPKSWLRKVAQNKANDHFRRTKTYRHKVVPNYSKPLAANFEVEITSELIEDGQLRMMFAVCHPDLKLEAQLCLALRVLCGFNIDEIAKALLSNKDAINKKLYRAKQKLKEHSDFQSRISKPDYVARIDNVLRIIYLVFNEGYYSSTSDQNIKEEICWEAMRLGLFLSKQDFLPQPKIHALVALMCFHSSRLKSRTGDNGQYILYKDQDKSKWNRELIIKGEQYLNKAAEGAIISKYHLEAAIAYWHTTEAEKKWENILQLYNKLLMIEYNPVIAMNRTYALAYSNSVEEAIQECEKLDLKSNHHYYCLKAELYRMKNDIVSEIDCLERAIKLANKESEKELIRKKLEVAYQ